MNYINELVDMLYEYSTDPYTCFKTKLINISFYNSFMYRKKYEATLITEKDSTDGSTDGIMQDHFKLGNICSIEEKCKRYSYIFDKSMSDYCFKDGIKYGIIGCNIKMVNFYLSKYTNFGVYKPTYDIKSGFLLNTNQRFVKKYAHKYNLTMSQYTKFKIQLYKFGSNRVSKLKYVN